MSRETRKKKIEEIEKKLGCKLLCFVTSDRPGAVANISRDCIKVIQQHLEITERPKRLGLYIVSHGGDLDVPWDVVTILRSHCRQLTAIVPYICHSAATLIALGCDDIIAGPRAQLSPTDPTLTVRTGNDEKAGTMQFGVEDINAFVEFIRDRLGRSYSLHGHEALAKLIDTVPPHLLGSINRNYFRSRLLIEKMLRLGKKKYTKKAVENIVGLLTVAYYAHTHFISRAEMKQELGLPLVDAEKVGVDVLSWELYEEYASELQSRKLFSAQAELYNAGKNLLTVELASKFVETVGRVDRFVEVQTISGTGIPNFTFTVPQVQGVPDEALGQVVQHFQLELQKQLQPMMVAKKISSFGEWRTE